MARRFAFPIPQGRFVQTILGFVLASLLLSTASRAADDHDDDVKTSGDLVQLAIPAVAGAIALEHKDRAGIIELGESAIVTLGLTYSLKYSINEKRPDGGSLSFPSGHTSISFCAAEFINRRYGMELGIPSFAAASFVGYSRVEAKRHYTRDVLAGAAIGFASSYFLTRPFSGVRLEPVANSNERGIVLSMSW